jgi:hypothetical protein
VTNECVRIKIKLLNEKVFAVGIADMMELGN